MPHLCPKRPTHARAGVTLIEAIMVILVLSASAVAGTIYFNRDFVTEQQTRLATQQVADILRKARLSATANQASVLVRRQRRGSIDLIRTVEDAGPFRDGETREVALPEGVRLSGRPLNVTFSPLGSADRAVNWNITLGESVGNVQLAPVSGQITQRSP